MSNGIDPRIPFVYFHSADHPFAKFLESRYGDLDAMRRNTELGLSAGTTKIAIVYPQFNGASWVEKAANAARPLEPAARMCTSFYELSYYPPIATNVGGLEVHVLCSTLYVVPQCLGYEQEHFWIFCEGQQVMVSSVVDVQNGQIDKMVIEYPNALGGTMDPRWHGIPDQRTSPMEYLRWVGTRAPDEEAIIGQAFDAPDPTADDYSDVASDG